MTSAAHCAGVQVRTKGHVVDTALDEQFATGRLYACIASRPGQCGRCDGYILEGKELEFYVSGCCANSLKGHSCCMRLSMQLLVGCRWALPACNDHIYSSNPFASYDSCMTCNVCYAVQVKKLQRKKSKQ